jgi:diguanylate cyclase (GGDEF)-like protein
LAEVSKAIRLLLVDDDDVDRERFRRLLVKSEIEVEVEEASSGREAMARLQEETFDCVILDYRLGDAIGTDLVRQIKSVRKNPAAIIMVTGRGDERTAVEAMREGVYDYISKDRLKSEHIVGAIQGSMRWAELEADLASAQERLKHISMFDALTELPNRNLFFDRLEQTLQAAKRNDLGFSVMMMDLNLFKEVNDTLGHAAGDTVLAQIGRRLSHLARAADTFARIGGDEFAALLVGCDSALGAGVVAQKIHDALSEPVLIGDELVHVTVSIGVALFPESGDESRTLLAHADHAMYSAKRSSRTCEIYLPAVGSGRPLLISSHLTDAVARSELFLEYQPKLHLGSGALSGVEALVRWQSPRLGLISPSDFIPIAERSLIIKPMTYAILEMALDQTRLWHDQGWSVPLAVNLSARMFDDADLVARTCEALATRGLEPADLTFEVTETALMTSPLRAREALQALHVAGIAISIDDFGAGFTSLKYLRDFKISEIKIDKMFITGLDATSRDVQIVRSIATLSRGFKLNLVAEGIEDPAVCGLLRDLGCDFGQGFALGRPMSAVRLEAWRSRRAAQQGVQQSFPPSSGTHAVHIGSPPKGVETETPGPETMHKGKRPAT